MKKSTTAAIVPEKPVTFKKYYYILGIIVFFLFANSIGNDYNMDDELVTRSHKLTSRGLEAVGDIFTSPYYSDNMGYAYGYRPIVHLSFAIEHQFFGEKPGVSHFFNVFLYVLSVILFFKLLLKWTGEKGIMLALLATVLFAIHPVHTEVVASIKNRDEILAFLFIICAGLSLERFLDRKKWISLFWILLCFSVAMLSKKSVFPMAILFPIIAIFVRGINLKELVFISISFVIPAVVFGSEMNWKRALVILGLCIAAIFAAFLMKILISKEIDWKKKLLDYKLFAAISLVLFFFAFWDKNLLYVYLAIAILIPVCSQGKRIVIILALLEMLVSAYFFQDYRIILLGLFVSLYITLENLHLKRNDWMILILSILFIGLIFWMDFKIMHLATIAATLFFLYFLNKKWVIAVAFALLVFMIQIILNDISFTGILFLIFSILKTIEIYWRKIQLLPFLLLVGMIVSFTYNYQSNLFKFDQQKQIQISKTSPNNRVHPKLLRDKNFLKEGRSLEMIENTLILPHSTSETIATGAVTLGEYMRLMVFPYELSFYYGYAKTKTVSLNNPWVWVSIVIHLMLIFLAFWQLKKRPLLSIGIAWYILSILLFSNWIELVAGMVGERLAFTASAGFCIFIASLLFWIKPDFSIKKPGLLEFGILAIVVVFAGRTFARNANWKTPLILMGHDIQHLHNSAQANNLYGLRLMESSFTASDETFEANQEKQRLAIQHFDKALQIWPEFFNAAYDKGRAGMSLRDTVVAIEGFEKAVSIGNENFSDPYYQLGNLYIQTKRNKEFLGISKKIYEISKDKVEGYSVLAKGYSLNGYADSAIMVLERGILKFPDNVDLKNNLELVKKGK